MVKGLFALNVGEMGWCLHNWQGHVRYVAQRNGYEHVVICDYPSNFDLYHDFAHEFITHDYPGIPLCQHKRISVDQPRIDANWFEQHGCKELEPYKAKGYDALFPPKVKPDVRNTMKDQLFIKFGTPKPELVYDIVIHARSRQHMPVNNWPPDKWAALTERLARDNLKMATIGLTGEAYGAFPGCDDRRDMQLRDLMDLMASSRLVIGPSSGPICLASLCGTPHLTWFGGSKYVGSGLRERFLNYWNPFKTKCWPLKLGWQPPVESVYQYIHMSWKELHMPKNDPDVHAPSNPKETPLKRTRTRSKPSARRAIVNDIDPERRARLAVRAAAVRDRQAQKSAAQRTGTGSAIPEIVPELDGDYLLIRVAPGIGDFSWLYSKLSTLKVPLAIQACSGGPVRMAPFADILPWVQHTSYSKLDFSTLRRRALPSGTTKAQLLEYFPNKLVNLEINTHLEGGNRIEKWMPELGTDYHYDITITDDRYEQALEVMPYKGYICIFASGISQIRNWKGWDERAWLAFMLDFRKRIADMPFVLIGAEWDKELGARIESRAKQHKIPFTNLTGMLHIGASLYIIKSSEYFVSFPSGLGILSDVLDHPATMFYSTALINMPGAYADPKNIESGQFNELLFCPPENLVTWLIEEYDFRNKL